MSQYYWTPMIDPVKFVNCTLFSILQLPVLLSQKLTLPLDTSKLYRIWTGGASQAPPVYAASEAR